jgi:hypothetical protein
MRLVQSGAGAGLWRDPTGERGMVGRTVAIAHTRCWHGAKRRAWIGALVWQPMGKEGRWHRDKQLRITRHRPKVRAGAPPRALEIGGGRTAH